MGKSPLNEDKLKEEQINLYLILSCLHLRYGFGKQRLAQLLGDFAENKKEYNKIKKKEGKWSADLQLLHAVKDCFGGTVELSDLFEQK